MYARFLAKSPSSSVDNYGSDVQRKNTVSKPVEAGHHIPRSQPVVPPLEPSSNQMQTATSKSKSDNSSDTDYYALANVSDTDLLEVKFSNDDMVSSHHQDRRVHQRASKSCEECRGQKVECDIMKSWPCTACVSNHKHCIRLVKETDGSVSEGSRHWDWSGHARSDA